MEYIIRDNTTQPFSKISIEKITDSIRAIRNQLIDKLLVDSSFRIFLEEHYDTFSISPVKLEFLRRELKELRNSPLDLAYYSSLIKRMSETNSTTAAENHPLIVCELKEILLKYGFPPEAK